MASFTDQTSQFNPYVSQLPVEAMVKVGMQKQAQYDAGVQKIQSYVDSIAGIDVYKDEHKAYLQSKLNELNSKLRTVAAGDFSNQQLVNSVGGMATEIVKDPIVQIARSSTQEIRKNQQRLEADIANGKAANQNEWDWNNQLANWTNDKDLKSSFRGRYKQFRDVDKKLRDVADKIHEIDNTIEIPYQRDANGQVIYDKAGKPVVDQAMLSIKTKGKPAEKILQAFQNSLDESDIDQLSINGRYHYRNSTYDTFKEDILKNYETEKKFLSDEIVNASVKLDDPKLTSTEQAILKARYNTLISARDSGALEKDLNAQLAELGQPKDIEGLKAKIYTKKYLTGLAKDMSWQSYEQEYKTNPYFQASMDLKNLQAKYDAMRQDDRHFMMTYAQNERRMAAEAAARAGNQPIVTPDALGTDIEKPTLSSLDTKIAKGKESLDLLNANYSSLIFTGDKDKALTPEEKKAKLDKLAENYRMHPEMNITDNNLRDYLEKRRAFEISNAQNINLRNYVAKETASFDKDIEKVLGGEIGIIDNRGRTMYTAKELYDLAKNARDFYTVASKDVEGKPIKKFDTQGYLKTYAGTKYEPAAVAFVKKMNNQALTATEKTIYDRGQKIVGKYDSAVYNIQVQKRQKESDILASRMPEFQTASGTLSKDNKDDMSRTDQLISHAIDVYNRLGALDVNKKGDFDPDTVNKWRQDAKTSKTLEYIVRKKKQKSCKLFYRS